MSKYQIITTFSADQYYNGYAKQHVESISKHISPKIGYKAYTSVLDCLPFVTFENDFRINQNVEKFRLIAAPHVEQKVTAKPWSNEYESGRMFMWDAVRFSYKMFALLEEAKENWQSRYLVWLDADTVAYNDITEAWLTSLNPNEAFITYLGRESPYTETGFFMLDRHSPCFYPFINTISEMYKNGLMFDSLQRWIDCEVFDYAKNQASLLGKARLNNLSVDRTGSVWDTSPLQSRLRHDKGLRKFS